MTPRWFRYATLLMCALVLCEASAQPREPAVANAYAMEPGERSVGFRLLEERDTSRAVTGGSGAAQHARPVRIYVWYPAERGGQAMRFGRYAEVADGDVWPAEIAGALSAKLEYSRRPLARSLGQDGFAALLRKPVLAVENAKPLAGPFPLVVLGVGLYYESPVSFAALGEYLAGRGFVVASAPLAGENSPVARVVIQDLEADVADLEFVIARARELPFVSRDTLGVIGFDMGGMAGLLLTMRNRAVDAYASIGSGLLFRHPSGLPRVAADFDPLALRVPWFHADRAQLAVAPADATEPSLFATTTQSERYLLRIENMDHFDFTSDAQIAGPDAMPGYWPPATPARPASSRAVARYLGEFFSAVLTNDAASRAALARDPEQSVPGRKLTLEHRAAAPAAITYEEFVAAVGAGRADEATAKLRAVAATEPNHFMLQQNNLDRLIVSMLFTWGLGKEAVPVIELMAERYPSPRADQLLVEGYVLAENYPAAIAVLTRFVEQNPNAAPARARLEELRKR
jgi:dienelactone hydrolase